MSYLCGEAVAPYAARFWSKVDTTRECWPWQAHIRRDGYGEINISGRLRLTHRVAYELIYGPIPLGFHVLHRCDNRPCVNPAHLFVGTNQDNVDDMVKKGRQPRGKTHGRATLAESDVMEIRRLHALEGVSGAHIARRLGLRPTTVYKVLARHTWAHL